MAIWRLKCFYETFVQGSTAGILLNFCAKIRHIANLQNVSGNAHETNNMTTTFKIILFPFFSLFVFACNNVNSQKESKPTQTDTTKKPPEISKQDVWTIERLYKEQPYHFDTILKNGYNIHFEYIKNSDEVNDIKSQLTLVKGKKIIDTLNNMG